MGTILNINEDDVKQAEAFSPINPGTYLFDIDNAYTKTNKAGTGENIVVSFVGAEAAVDGKRLLKYFPMKTKDGRSALGFMKPLVVALGEEFVPGLSINIEAFKGRKVRIKVTNQLDDSDNVRNNAADFYAAD